MVRFGLVLNRTSLVLVCIVPFMLTAIPFSLHYRADDIRAILLAAGATLAASLGLYATTSKEGEVTNREGILVTTLSWVFAAGFGALPFYFYGTFPTYTDCYFEAMSGFTTTGSSVLADIEAQPAGILFWRDLMHWIGGMGIVVLSLAILPALGAGGMQLFKAEVPGPTADKLVPRLRDTATRLYSVYAIISAVEVVLLLLGGLSLFDSLTHMFGTMGTGGFSPKNASVGHYKSVYVDLVVSAFMFIAGANFMLHHQALARRDFTGYARDEEFRFFTGAVVFFTVTVAVNLVVARVYPNFWEALRHALFSVVSIITTTGFATEDFEKWPAYGHYVLLLLMFLGGCAGSTGGAIKCVRVWMLLKIAANQVFRIVHPKAVRTIRYNGRLVPPDVLAGIQSMFVLYMAVFLLSSLAFAWLGYDVVTAISATAATLGNIGPGLGTVGPAENYAHFSDPAKWICSFNMLVGRLEVYSVVALFFPEFWRK
ncbi:MAG: TrkH family potassium uptake protein [Zetaproteobacteria bacterium]|nr:MAG: TrkH family potassium uptake protein [Zetaproteobacteria bacterium]